MGDEPKLPAYHVREYTCRRNQCNFSTRSESKLANQEECSAHTKETGHTEFDVDAVMVVREIFDG